MYMLLSLQSYTTSLLLIFTIGLFIITNKIKHYSIELLFCYDRKDCTTAIANQTTSETKGGSLCRVKIIIQKCIIHQAI